MMTAQQYLGRYRAAQVDMQRSERLIRKITALLEVQGMDTTSEKVQTSNNDDRTARLIAELVDARKEFEATRETSIGMLREIARVIGEVEQPLHKQLLEMRYIDGLTWFEISNNLHVTYRHVFNLHHRALEEIEGKYTFLAE